MASQTVRLGTLHAGIAYGVWAETGAELGDLGEPASSLYVVDGRYHIDFEGGHLEQLLDDTIAVVTETSPRTVLPDPDTLRGRLISSRDGTGWFVDNELRRWWIPNIATWNCAGGGDNEAATGLPCYEIHKLEFGGVAPCPAGRTGTNPAIASGLKLSRYCQDQIGPDARAEFVDDDWFCQSPAGLNQIVPAEICVWQYGADATWIENPEPWSWKCSV